MKVENSVANDNCMGSFSLDCVYFLYQQLTFELTIEAKKAFISVWRKMSCSIKKQIIALNHVTRTATRIDE